ncbi:hypothetical protein Tco_0967781 [Tanacetum coccineum]
MQDSPIGSQNVKCDNHDLSRLDNQSIERDRLIGIGFVLNFVKFISFTFGDKEMISVIEAIIREVFVKLLLDSFGKLSIRKKGGFSLEFARLSQKSEIEIVCDSPPMEGADNSVVYYDARSKDSEACLEKGEEALSERDMKSNLYVIWNVFNTFQSGRIEHGRQRLDNQFIEHDRLIGIGFVLNFVKFILFTFGDKEMISVIEAVLALLIVNLRHLDRLNSKNCKKYQVGCSSEIAMVEDIGRKESFKSSHASLRLRLVLVKCNDYHYDKFTCLTNLGAPTVRGKRKKLKAVTEVIQKFWTV